MLSLYWKIFIGFWFSSLILGSGGVFLTHRLNQQSPSDLQGLAPVKIIDRSVFIARRLPEEIDAWQRQLAENDIQLFVLHTEKSPLSQPLFSPEINALFAALDESHYSNETSLTRLRIARKERSINGQEIKFVLDMPSPNVFKAREILSSAGTQLVLGLLISALVCYILARYLTRNIEQLSIAARALARGDLSARARLSNLSRNDELSNLGHDFNQMATALETSKENQNRLIRDISHELRSPLARLQIALEIARRKTNSDELNRIDRESQRLNELIGQLLAMPDDDAPLTDTVDIVELMNSIIEDCTIEAEVKQVKLLLETDYHEALVAATVKQLHSAFENIIRNAIQYTRNDSQVKVIISTQPGHDAVIAVGIIDQGPGVPEQDIGHIFEPFYRVDRARNRNTGGYGIGLAIVQRVITRHAGQVKANNADDGLCVNVTLPALAIGDD
ncbi:MAG: hypothetical protein CL691_02590 [Cellvibrionales bacterium]|nr:hypothetical protein [Cellvibrionales bacterium]|tara:strand:- start:2267 stop:3610 length:1344 start_codon:yes stop_codon:yes gene_type:complete